MSTSQVTREEAVEEKPLSECRMLAERIRQIQAELTERHNWWLSNNDPQQFYRHIVHAWRVEHILEFTRDVEGRVLDIACFVGFIAEQILKQNGRSRIVVGVDRVAKALEFAARRGVQTVLTDLNDTTLPFPDQHFDCVLLCDVLVNLYDPDTAIEEVFRVVKPAGKLIITVPNLASLGNRVLMLFGYPPYNLETRPLEGGYMRCFTFDTLRKLLRDHDFVVQNMESTMFHFPLYRWPFVHRFFRPAPEWQRHRLFFNRSLARIFPELGDNIIAVARKPA